ncbi:MAG: DUF1707 SHOCT-like domain-containing protein [Gemmatimonadota bacterium]
MTESVPDRRSAAPAALERTIEALEQHYVQDHISLAEFERRLDDAYAGRGPDEWRSLLSDLPALSEPARTPPARREFVVNVLGGSERRGRWTAPAKLVVVPLAGGVVLDFREVDFTTEEVEVAIASVLGDVLILVPPDLRVAVGGLPILGTFQRQNEGGAARADAPLLRVKGVALAGRIEVRVMKPGEAHRVDW